MRRLSHAAACLVATLCLTVPAFAQSTGMAVAIAPLGSTLLTGDKQGALQEVFTVSNSGAALVTFEVELFSWGQDPLGQMVLSETSDFVVYPKALTIAPGKSRPVRLIRRAEAPVNPEGQTYYRLRLREVPQKFKAEGEPEVRVALATQILLPLVVQPKHFKAAPTFSLHRSTEGLRVKNQSTALVKLTGLYCGEKQLSGLLYVQPGISALLPGATCDEEVRSVREGGADETHPIQPAS